MKDLLNMGVDLLVTKALSGELTAENIWMAVKGATKYRKAMAKGDVADRGLAMKCKICCGCPSIAFRDTGVERDGGVVLAGSCGPILEEHGGDKPTCGCLVSVKINGADMPAGKTRVRSEVCPQGKW
jgi:hypothetical protein